MCDIPAVCTSVPSVSVLGMFCAHAVYLGSLHTVEFQDLSTGLRSGCRPVILAVAARGKQRLSLIMLESASTAVASQVGGTRHKRARQRTSLHLLKIKEDPYFQHLLPTILCLRKSDLEGIKVTW